MIRARHIKGFLSSLDNKQTITYLLRSIVFYVCFLLFAGADILGQTTYTSVKSGPWHEAATWGGSGTPGKSDIAIIEKNHTVTIYPAFPGWPEVNINKLIVKASGKLEFWGANYLYVNNADGLIQVDNDGIIDGGIFANSYIVYRTSNDQQLIVNGSVTNLGGLVFSNSESTISISGNGNINIRHNIRLTGNNNITVINSLAGSLTVGGDIIFERNNCEFINKGTGNVSVGGDLVFKELNCEFINNGELNILKCIRVDQPNKNNNILRNDPSGRITLGSDFNPRYSRFIIDNSGFVDLNGNITNVEPGEVKIYNRAGSEFRWAGQELDLNSNPNSNPNLMLYCDYDSNNFIYDGTGPQSIIPPRDSAYWNLITNGANTKTLKGQIIIRNDLTIGTGSILDVSSNNYNIEIEGDWVHETGGQFTERQGTVIFSGANSQKMTVDGAETFYGLTVDKTGGLVNLINGNITVSNLMTLTSGNIDIGSNNLIIPSSGSIAGGSSSSYVVTEGTGSLKRYVNGAISFPIGAATSYLPIILNNTGSPDNFSANIFQSVTVNGLLGGSQVPDYDDYVKYTWRVVEENPGGSDLAVTVQWNGTPDEGTGFSRSECSMGYHNSVSWSSEAPSAVLAALPYTKTRTGIAGGGSFSVGNKCTRVGDHQPPVITAMPTDTMGYLNGDCEFIIPDYRSGFTVSDNCAVPVITQSPVGSTLSGHGTTQDIVFTIDDGHGNVLTRSIRLTLRDTIPPVITAMPTDTTGYLNGDCEFIIPDYRSGFTVSDNCAVPVITQSPVGSTLSGHGTTQDIVFTIDDGHGNVLTRSIRLTLRDTIPPVITAMPTDTTGYLNGDCEFIIPDYRSGFTVSDNCAVPVITQSPVGSTLSGHGTTQDIVFTIDDGHGNVLTRSIRLTLRDTIPPVITAMPTDTTGYLNGDCEFIIPDYRSGFTVSDNCAVPVITQSPVGSTLSGHGTTQDIVFTIDDGHGNVLTRSIRLTLRDTIPPVITAMPTDTTGYLNGDCEFIIPDYRSGFTVSDNCAVPVITQSPVGSTLSGHGTTQDIVFTIDDGHGNVLTRSIRLTLRDTIPPVITAMPTDTTGYLNGDCEFIIPDYRSGFTVSDNCAVPVITQSPVGSTLSGHGTTQDIVFTIDDGHGNVLTRSIRLTLRDTIPPVITAMPTDTTGYLNGDCEFIIPDYRSGFTVSDNCAVPVITQSPVGSTLSGHGTTQDIVFTIDDGHGNVLTRSIRLTLRDTIPPVITAMPTDTTGYLNGDCEFIIPDYRSGFTVSDNCAVPVITQSPVGSTLSGHGTTQDIVFTIDDGHGNVLTRSIRLTLRDTIPPVITAMPTDTTGYLNGDCEFIIPDYRSGFTVSDNCAVPVITQSPVGSTLSGHGTTQDIVFTIDDGHGNVLTRSIRLTLRDTIPPVITAMPTDTTGYLNGDCEFIIPDYRSGFTVSDNCAVPVITQSPVGSTLSGHGTTQDIVFTIDDGHGNVLTRSIRLTLRDTIPPVFTAPPNITICRDLDCKFNIDVINTGDVHDELDNCSTGIEAYVYKDDFTNSLDCDNAGYVTRIWRLEDGNGNFTEHQQIIYIEPTPRVTGTISNDIICNNTPVTYTVTTPTTAIYGVRFDVQVINPHPEVTGVNNRTGLEDSDTITETPSNTDDSPKMITYIITPYTITSDGYYKCAGINDTMRLWINPTPVVIPVNVNPICYGGLTDINLVTPTKMTSGIINFDFFVSNTGDIVGDTIDGEDLVHGDKISRSFINNSDTIQSVNFWIIASNDDLGCIGDTTLAEVKVHALPLQDLIITKPLTCEGGSDATLKAVFSKGATPLSVNWIGPSGYEENYTINDSIQEVSGLEGGGVYRVTVTDNLNCRNSLDAAPVGAIFDTHFYLREKASGYGTTCPGSDDGEIWVTQRGGSSGIPPFNYWIVYNDDATIYTGILLSKGATDTLKNLRPGRYKLYLHDANGCFDISYPEINIVDPPPIEISFRIDRNITCKNYSDGSVSASVTGGIGEYSYLWYRPPYDPPLEITDNEASLDGISAGKYYLRIIDQMGCIKTDSITIDEPEGMTLVEYDLSMSNHPAFHISCNGASDGYIKLSVEGGSGEYTYLWTGPDGFTAITRDIFNLKAGIYDCTVTDIGGCELMPHPHFELVEPDILSVTAVSPLFGAGPYNIGCFGETGSIDVTVTGGTTGSYYYEWTTSNGSGLVTDEGDQEHVSAGIYTLVVTDLNGCTETTTVTLTQPAEIVLELIPTHITCQSETFDNGSINLVLSGGVEPYSYEWSDEEGPIPGGILQDIYDLTPGTYTVMVTDANGCRVSGSVEVTLPPDLEYEKRVSKYGDYQISCFGRSDGFIQITPTSGREPYVVSWQMPDGSVSASNDLAGLTAGEYILYITDSNMCSARDTIRLEEPGKLTMNVTVSDQICSNDHTGSIAVEAVNNAGPVDYLWADGVIGNYREGLSAGAYRIIITDSNNCNADSTILINEAEPIKLLFTVIQPECTDMPDGSVTVTASGGTGPGTYSYLWSDGSTGERINTVASGWYSVAVADINGCYVRDSVFVAPKKEVCLNIPNAISPNGDGVNDEWNIGLKELYPLMEVKIFNRWGELLWASEKGYPNPWDGRSRGAVLPVDCYNYTIDLHNGSKLIIGHITIVR